MADSAMDTYLNDHLAGAMFGSDLAEHLQARTEGTSLGELMKPLASEIEEDRQTLIDLMERMGTTRNPVKQATMWLAEKASRAKFGGLTTNETGLGTFLALEALSLGVEGKVSLWTGACMYTSSAGSVCGRDAGSVCGRDESVTTQGFVGLQVPVSGGADTFIGAVPDGATVTATNTDGTPGPVSRSGAAFRVSNDSNLRSVTIHEANGRDVILPVPTGTPPSPTGQP